MLCNSSRMLHVWILSSKWNGPLRHGLQKEERERERERERGGERERDAHTLTSIVCLTVSIAHIRNKQAVLHDVIGCHPAASGCSVPQFRCVAASVLTSSSLPNDESLLLCLSSFHSPHVPIRSRVCPLTENFADGK